MRIVFLPVKRLRGLLTGNDVPLDTAEVWCGSIAVARVSAGQLTAVACASPAHGTHPRFAAKMDVLRRRGVALPPAAPCAACGGAGFLPVPGEAATQLIASALALSVFRGIPLEREGDDAR